MGKLGNFDSICGIGLLLLSELDSRKALFYINLQCMFRWHPDCEFNV